MNKITAVFVAILSIVSSQDLDWRLGQEWNEDTFDIDEDALKVGAGLMAYLALRELNQ